MSKLPVQLQLAIAFITINLVLLILNQPLLLIDGLVSLEIKLNIIKLIGVIGALSLASVLISNSGNSKTA